MTIEDVYTKLVELTELCEQGFIDMRTQLDAFIEDVIEMKRGMKQ